MGCSRKPKGPLTVAVMDKKDVMTPEMLAREVLLLSVNSAGSWAVKPLGSLTLNALNAALGDDRTAFLLLGTAEGSGPQETAEREEL